MITTQVIGSVGVSTSRQFIGAAFRNFNQQILKLFTNGEQGFAYDPNDLTTLYQDAAGTIPVTAAGQPVGLMLDKSNGLVLGTNMAFPDDIIGQGVGGLEFKTVAASKALEIGFWYKITINVSNYSGTGDVGITGTNTSFPTSNIPTGIRSKSSNGLISFIALAQTNNAVTLYTRSTNNADFTDITIQKILGNHASQTVSASRPILQQTPALGNSIANKDNWITSYIDNVVVKQPDGRYKIVRASPQSARLVQNVPLVAGKQYLVSIDVETFATTLKLQTFLNTFSSVGAAILGSVPANTRTKIVTNFVAPESAIYIGGLMNTEALGDGYILGDISVQEVVGYRTDRNYLKFDGVDDFLQTNNIDFTATDKVSLFAGVRKLSDAAPGILCELSTSVFESNNSGAFAALAPGNATLTTFRPYSRGTVLANTNAVPTAPAPNSFVGTAKMAISIPKIDVRVDGVDRVFTNQDQGAGNYGNYPLYIGRRAGTVSPFNGHLYSLIGIGRLTTDSETIALEKSIAKNTGVTLNV